MRDRRTGPASLRLFPDAPPTPDMRRPDVYRVASGTARERRFPLLQYGVDRFAMIGLELQPRLKLSR